ncbi:hypothetical protein GCM10023311_15260 [Flaviramulus aquimarinus]|uniref:PKD domain-containing protein n=1 Tax=Flaviramulus aquimarinus TaxID=1170456 RepID=A0ABP9F2K6_9FLAO
MNNIFKKGFYILAALFLSIVITSCEDDDNEIISIQGLDFVIATLNLEGTEIGVVPTTVNSNNRIIYSVDFGTTPDIDTDNLATSGPMVTFEYPNEDGTYFITVTASLQGTSDVSVTKEITITEYIPPVTGPPSDPIAGTWKLAPQAGSLGVGPGFNNPGWFSISADQVLERACLYDDLYIFNEDGTFQNVLGSETWVEAWQGTDPETCGAPVFPHDGTASATYTYDAVGGTVTIDGKGAFLGLAKVFNGGELGSPGAAPESITYMAELVGDTLELDIQIDAANDAWWTFTLVREVETLVGTWKLAPQAGSLGVGPGFNNPGWFSISADQVLERDCLYDDQYIFNEDGTFQNVLGSETWVEAWQGTDPETCGAPVFPHDGTASATYSFDETAGELTLDGKGAFLGLAKVFNGGELGSPGAAPDSITYMAVLDGNVLELDIQIDAANDAWWTFTLVKE